MKLFCECILKSKKRQWRFSSLLIPNNIGSAGQMSEIQVLVPRLNAFR